MNKKVSQVSRSLFLALTVLLVQSVEIQAQNVSEKAWERYKTWASGLYPERDVALAVAPNGSWYANFGISKEQAKVKALNGCKYSQHNPSNTPCIIVDVNFDSETKRANENSQVVTTGSTEPRSNGQMSDIESECYEAFHRAGGRWWKRNIITGDNDSDFNVVPCFPFVSRDMKTWVGSTSEPTNTSVATTNPSSSAQDWCARYPDSFACKNVATNTQGYCAKASSFFPDTRTNCDAEGGKWFSTYGAAKAEHLLLKNQSSTVATTTSNSDIQGWCATKHTVFKSTNAYCDTKGGRWNWTYNAAKAEHRRLKNQSSTAATTASDSSTQGYCAKASSFFPDTRTNCDAEGGKWFSTYGAAKAEHLRLKRLATAPSSQPPQETAVETGSAEIVFWQSIKDSDDPDMYREYLRQFPSGTYAGLAKIKIKKLGGSATSVAQASIPNLDYGDYYALVIGNNRYQNLRDLRSAVNDAKAISSLLEIDYGFNVELLENATRKDILQSLKRLRETARAKDNVLIYYAGHGSLDQAADEGYWLPVDAERDDDSNWILTDRVTSQVKAMKAKHVMVVADSCFSGTITRAIKIEQRTPEWLSEIVKKKARTALTSGGLEPVLDTGSGNHSAFAHAFISLLEENNGVLDASQLFSQLRPKVMVNSTQTPQYGKIHMAGDDGGDFLFVRQ